MGAHEREEFGRDGDNVRTGGNRLVDVDHLTNAADDDLGWTCLLTQRAVHLPNHRTGVVTRVPDTAPEQTDERRPCIGCHHGLIEGHATRAVHFRAHAPQLVYDPQLVPANRHLDRQMLIITELVQEALALHEHLVGIGRE